MFTSTVLYSHAMGIDANRVIAQLADAGLDLVHVFDAHAIAALATTELASAIHARPNARHDFAQEGSVAVSAGSCPVGGQALAAWARLANGPRLGLLVGNTRALWPHFVAARDSLPAKDPLDTYVERTFARVLDNDAARDTNDPRAAVLYAHRSYDGAFLPFQHLAVAIGFGALTEGRLVVHPIYGPWFALRAVITIDGEPPESEPTSTLVDLDSTRSGSTPRSIAPIRDAPIPIASLFRAIPIPIAKPCVCTGACAKALDAALANTTDWRAWLAVRDACSLRAWRYSDEQIRFHYASAWPAAKDD